MKENRILVIGSNGQLGRELVSQGSDFGVKIIGIDINELDIRNYVDVEKYLNKLEFSLVVNAAAYTAVDLAESEPDIAFAVNVDGPCNLAIVCNKKSIPLIHISTDYVFDGLKKDAYVEEDPISPVGIYAQSKAQGEQAIAERTEKYIIIRTAWLYSVHGNNFVKTMLRLAREKNELKVVNDQFGCPTSAEDLAAIILEICNQIHGRSDLDVWEIYHYCGMGKTTWYGFAHKIFEIASAYENLGMINLKPITTEEYPTTVLRPVNSVLNCTRIEQTFGIRRKSWQDSLASTLQKLYST